MTQDFQNPPVSRLTGKEPAPLGPTSFEFAQAIREVGGEFGFQVDSEKQRQHQREQDALDRHLKRTQDDREQVFRLCVSGLVVAFLTVILSVLLIYSARVISNPSSSAELQKAAFAFWGATVGAAISGLVAALKR